MKMKTTTPPTPRRKNPYLRKPVCVTLHPLILARLNARGCNRSEQINYALARLFLIEDGKADMDPAERRRFKALAFTGIIHGEHEKLTDEQETATNRENQPTPTPTPSSPELKSPMVMTTPSETECEFESLNEEQYLTYLENHPEKSSALTLGLVVKVAKHYASTRDRHEELAQTADQTGMRA